MAPLDDLDDLSVWIESQREARNLLVSLSFIAAAVLAPRLLLTFGVVVITVDISRSIMRGLYSASPWTAVLVLSAYAVVRDGSPVRAILSIVTGVGLGTAYALTYRAISDHTGL